MVLPETPDWLRGSTPDGTGKNVRLGAHKNVLEGEGPSKHTMRVIG